MRESTIHRLMGGSPLAVLLKLVVLSTLVGAAMAWLDIEPRGLFLWVEGLAFRLCDSGLDAVRQFAGYVAAGAAIVVPIWIFMRVMSAGSARPQRPAASRWSIPGTPPPADTAPPAWRQDSRT